MTTNQHTRLSRTCAAVSAALLALGMSTSSGATVPDTIDYQAYLSETDGTPIDGTISITFAVYNVDIGGVPLWSQTESVMVDQGLFNVALANPVNPFPAGLFDGPVYLGMFVAGEEMLPRRALTSSAYSFKAADADTLEGATASDLDQSGEVASLQGDVATAQGDIGTLQNDVGSNDSRITNLENTAGDITSVVAGPGLAGGGPSGDVVLQVGPGAVNSTMLAPGSVTSTQIGPDAVTSGAIADGTVSSADIQNGAVAPGDMAVSGNFQLQGVTVGSAGLRVESVQDVIILDDFNGFRWRSTDNSTELGSITVREQEMVMRHTGQSRDVFRSNTTGISLAGAVPSSTYAVTVPSLDVVGTANIGYEIVTVTYQTETEINNCHSHGGAGVTCYIGSSTVSCPTGKKVIGGGASGSSGHFGSVSQSRPNGTSGWSCAVSYDLANSNRTCFAICADVD